MLYFYFRRLYTTQGGSTMDKIGVTISWEEILKSNLEGKKVVAEEGGLLCWGSIKYIVRNNGHVIIHLNHLSNMVDDMQVRPHFKYRFDTHRCQPTKKGQCVHITLPEVGLVTICL